MTAISCALDVPTRIRLGEPLIVRFTLTNNTDEDYYLLTWFTPLEGINSPCLSIQREGKPIPYDGRLIKRAPEPPTSAYVLIPADGSISREVDVTESYPIDAAGQYEIKVQTEIPDHIKTSDVDTIEARSKVYVTAPLRQLLASDVHQVQVEDGSDFKRTIASRVREEQALRGAERQIKADQADMEEALAYGSGNQVKILGGSSQQQSDAALAWGTAYRLVFSALRAISSTAYSTWFGTGNVNTVNNTYQRIKDAMRSSGAPVQYPMPPNPYRELDLSSNGCQAGWFAYTYNGSMTIWLCGGFWSAPLTGIDSRSGTIVHELSHSVAGTQDIVYGTVNAQTLATNNPGQAVTNADNFEYFAESVPLLPVGPYDFAPRGQAESSVLSQFHR